MHLFLINVGGGEKAYFFFLCEGLGERGMGCIFFFEKSKWRRHTHIITFAIRWWAFWKIISLILKSSNFTFISSRHSSESFATRTRFSKFAIRKLLAFILSDRIRAVEEARKSRFFQYYFFMLFFTSVVNDLENLISISVNLVAINI